MVIIAHTPVRIGRTYVPESTSGRQGAGEAPEPAGRIQKDFSIYIRRSRANRGGEHRASNANPRTVLSEIAKIENAVNGRVLRRASSVQMVPSITSRFRDRKGNVRALTREGYWDHLPSPLQITRDDRVRTARLSKHWRLEVATKRDLGGSLRPLKPASQDILGGKLGPYSQLNLTQPNTLHSCLKPLSLTLILVSMPPLTAVSRREMGPHETNICNQEHYKLTAR